MDSKTFDAITKSLNNNLSRRRAMRGMLGGAVLAAAAASLVPRPAEAGSKAQKRCRNKGGVYAEKGTCHCTSVGCDLTCHGNPVCHCYETVGGRGFCAGEGSTGNCNTTPDCQVDAGEVCAKTCIGLVCVPPARHSG
jgi:hypothetical protein